MRALVFSFAVFGLDGSRDHSESDGQNGDPADEHSAFHHVTF